MNEKQKKELFSMSDIKRMTEKFDVKQFYEKYKDYLAVMMITPNQVVVTYCKTDEVLCHEEIINFLCNLLTKNGEKSIISISFANEKDLWNTLFMKQRKGENNPTTKMIKVVELIYNQLFVPNDQFDIEHNEIDDVFSKVDNTNNKETATNIRIIGIPIDVYIKRLNEQIKAELIKNNSENDER